MTDSDSSSSANDSREDDMIRHNDEGHDKPARPLRMPKAIVFDLDYTLWPLWVDTHVSPPIKRKKDGDINLVHDRYGSKMSFYRDVPSILLQLKEHEDVHVAVASRTSAPDAAAQALDQLLIPGTAATKKSQDILIRAMECFQTKEIYPGSKLRHFKEIHRKTKIPYEEMVFFDDESRNREVASLGVTFVLVPEGVNRHIFEKGLADWRIVRAKAEKAVTSDDERVFVERQGATKTKRRVK